MKSFLLLILFFAFSGLAICQSETTEYLPVEGRSETGIPADLQGTWVLVSGIEKTPSAVGREIKPAPGTETRRDSVTTTENVNGVTHTTTVVEIDRIGVPDKTVTQPQSNKMHKAEKPGISFYGQNETFSGFTGCNKYSGRYSISGHNISLKNATASTQMLCMGDYDEKTYLNTLKKVTAFKTNNGNLELMDGENVLLVFEKK